MKIQEKVFKTFVVLVSALMFPSFSIKTIFSSDGGSSEKKGQKVLLPLIFFTVDFLVFLNNEAHYFRCLEYFLLFSKDAFFQKLVPK